MVKQTPTRGFDRPGLRSEDIAVKIQILPAGAGDEQGCFCEVVLDEVFLEVLLGSDPGSLARTRGLIVSFEDADAMAKAFEHDALHKTGE